MLKQMLNGIYQSRYFWWHLALADLRAKYQRTSLGMMWSMIQPLAMTLLYGFVLTSIFHQPVVQSLIFIYSGIICWDLILFAAVSGTYAFINAAPYLNQFPHPIAIYPLRVSLVGGINFLFAFLGFLGLVLILNPNSISITWLSIPIGIALLLLTTWPIAIICAIIGTIYRDLSQAITIFLQAIWFVSPVFFQPQVFINGHIEFLVYYNPLYHLLQLIRCPFIDGVFPSLINYGVTVLLILALWIPAGYLLLRFNRRMILYV